MSMIFKRRLASVIAILLAILLLFVGCGNGAGTEDNANESPTEAPPDTTAKTPSEPPTEEDAEPVKYYVCPDTKDPVGTAIGKAYDSLDDAKGPRKRGAVYGYRVATEDGEFVYSPYTELQNDILRESKWLRTM